MTKVTNLLDNGSVVVLHVPYGGDYVKALDEFLRTEDRGADIILRIDSDDLRAGGPYEILYAVSDKAVERLITIGKPYVSQMGDGSDTQLPYLNISTLNVLPQLREGNLGYHFRHEWPSYAVPRLKKYNRLEMMSALADRMAVTLASPGSGLSITDSICIACACMGHAPGEPRCRCAMRPYHTAARLAVLTMLTDLAKEPIHEPS